MTQSFSLFLPLKRRMKLDPGDFIAEMRLLVEQTGATVRIDPRSLHQPAQQRGGLLSSFRGSPPETVAFELDGVRLRVAMHSEPFAERLEMGRFVNPVMWDHGLGEFADHRAHFRVHEAGIEGEEGPDATFDRAAAVTATASVVSRFAEPVGAVWAAGRNSVPMATFRAAMDKLRDGQAPLDFWLRWQVLAPGEMEDLEPGLITVGLAPFIGNEVLVRPSETPTKTMIEHAFEVARQMIDEKLAVSDGQVIAGAEEQPLRLKLGVRHSRADAPLCEIIALDAATAPRPSRRRNKDAPAEASETQPAQAGVSPGGLPVGPGGPGGGVQRVAGGGGAALAPRPAEEDPDALVAEPVEDGPVAPPQGLPQPLAAPEVTEEPAPAEPPKPQATPGRRVIRLVPSRRRGPR